MDSLSAFEGAGWGHVSHSLYATVRSGPGPSTPTSLFLKTCRETIQAGLARERQAELAGRIPETWFFRCPALRIGDAVQWWCLPGPLKPSMAAVSLALPGQTAPSRHHHCPAHWAAEPPRVRKTSRTFLRSGVCGGESSKEHRDRVGPYRTVFGQGWPKSSLQGCTCSVSWTGTPDPGAGSLERKVSGILPGGCKPPFRGLGPLPQGPLPQQGGRPWSGALSERLGGFHHVGQGAFGFFPFAGFQAAVRVHP